MVPARVTGQVCSTGAQADIPVTVRRQGFQQPALEVALR